jgi:hypothetical protein
MSRVRARVRAAVFVGTMATMAINLSVVAAACGGRVFGRVYEYEEDLFLSLDGSADLIVNASLPALAALRGLDVSIAPATRLDREKIRALYESSLTRVSRVSSWRRKGRRFVQVRLRIADVRKLSQVPPFAWSTYELTEKDGLYVYRQTIGPAAHRPGTLQNVGWTGGELVAFRLHLPSRIEWHNARDLETDETSGIARGNILSWEQQLTDRLDGRPISIEVRLDRQTILYRTLWLFAGAFAAAIALIAFVIWLTIRKGARDEV